MAHCTPNKLAIATNSLGKHPLHSLERKIQAAKVHGFDGIELVYTDLVDHAVQNSQSILESAQQIKSICQSYCLEILTLNPLKYFEGNLLVSLAERLDDAKRWIEIAVKAGTSIIQIPSQFLPDSTGDDAIIVNDLQSLADLAAKDGILLAYEGVSFAKHNPTWQDALRIVNAVNRPNFGMCLDSFHIHSYLWGDATSETGVLPGGPAAYESSMKELVDSCPKEKVFYIQLSDASRFDPPLTEESPSFYGLEVKDPRLAWSRYGRPFPLEGYFPVVEIARSWLLEWGWTGWVSMESFLKETELEENGPEVMASRASKSVQALYARI